MDHWRSHVRALVADEVAPRDIVWIDPSRAAEASGDDLFEFAPGAPLVTAPVLAKDAPVLSLPRAFIERLRTVKCYRSPEMWRVAYELLWRIVRGERDLLSDPLDPDVVAFQRMEKAIRRDAHKMHAFVRFRRIDDETARNGERFIAWYEPTHLIVEREAAFFQRRFPSMDWSILSPDRCSHFDGDKVSFSAGVDRSAAPTEDELEDLWCLYYASIFNPARVKLKAMTAEMPKKFWHTLPETAQIPELLADVPRRLEEMAKNSRRMADSAMPFIPHGAPVDELRAALSGCEGCELFKNHTRPVLSEGQESATLALLGEQPGDAEEREGRPFIGPAGQVLQRALSQAGLVREDLYLTNAVKHFRHEMQLRPGERGKRRLHKRPTIEHVSRCQPWLDAEMFRVKPSALVCLGVTASRAVFGPTFRALKPDEPAEPKTSRYAKATLTTFHPAAILRASSPELAQAMEDHLVDTLRRAALSA